MKGKKQFYITNYHLIRYFRLTVSLYCLFTFFPNLSQGQLYIDFPVQLDYYRTNSSDLNFSRRGVIVNPTIGFTLTTFDSSKFELSNGFGAYYSKFNQEAGDESFHYQRIGLVNYNIQLYYHLRSDFRIGFGTSVGVYSNTFGKFIKVEGEDSSDKEDRLGKGLRFFNVGNFFELRYSMSSGVSIGSKFTYWYVPQLRYRTIDDFGEFNAYKTDLFTTRLEFSIRLEIE